MVNDRNKMANSKFLVVFLAAVGCGETFATDWTIDDAGIDADSDVEVDAGSAGSGGSDAGAPTTDAGDTGVDSADAGGSSSGGSDAGGTGDAGGSMGGVTTDAGGPDAGAAGVGGTGGAGGTAGTGGEATGTGGAPAPGLPPCCVDADCPSEYPYCTPWGTCGPGGDPYSCNYDFHCESYCYHCTGMRGGTCNDEKSCDCI